MKSIIVAALVMSSLLAHAQDAKTPATEADVLAKAKTSDMGCQDVADITVKKFTNTYNYSYEKPTDKKHTAIFFIATCPSGAYNESSILFRDDPYSGLMVLPLASPKVNEKNKIIGWTADVVVPVLTYDEKSNTLIAFSKGRGLGDMFTNATYAILEDNAVLTKYDLDNTADEKIDPVTIFESKEALNR
jgi:hypothetical protein